ncbi:MAG TPA: hypothetical protein VGA67_02080 [Candidatus Dojkabacteria bacterium]|jgi:hypothetical protein
MISLSRKSIIKIFLLILLILSVFVSFSIKVLAQDDGETTLDLECVNRLISENRADEINDVCVGSARASVTVLYAPEAKCEEKGLSCDPETQRCISLTETSSGLIDHVCIPIYTDNSSCTDCDPDEGKRCLIANALAIQQQNFLVDKDGNRIPPGPGSQTEEYQCVDDSNINIFGVNMGPLDIAVAKIVRTIFTVLLGFGGTFTGIRLVLALWGTTQRTTESYENVQKTVLGSLIGLLLSAGGIVLVQLLSSAFGISGNIFEFSFNP